MSENYDFHRLGSRRRQRRDEREWETLVAALAETEGIRTLLDLPCGTGRFTGRLARRGYEVVAGDISMEMMRVARSKSNGERGVAGYAQADAEALPFRDDSLDCVVCARFLFHVDAPTRVELLREMARVSRRWLIVDYRHRYTVDYLVWRLKRLVGLTREPLDRVTRKQLEEEFRNAGISLLRVLSVTPVFSDKWIVIGET